MFNPKHTLSRIARYSDRPAEAAAHTASLVAVVTTLVMVGTGQVAESNPVSAWIHSQVGLETWALLTPIGVGVALWFSRHLPSRQGKLNAHRAIVAALSIDALGNCIVFVAAGVPITQMSTPIIQTTAFTIIIASCVYWRADLLNFANLLVSQLASRTPSPSREATRAIGFSILMITAIPAGVAFVGTQPLGSTGSGTVEAASSGTVWVGNGSGYIFEFDSDGTKLTQYNISNSSIKYVYATQYHIYATTNDGHLYKVNHDGVKVWSKKLDKPAQVKVDEDRIYVGDNATIKKFYLNGTKIWETTLTSGADTGWTALAKDPSTTDIFASHRGGTSTVWKLDSNGSIINSNSDASTNNHHNGIVRSDGKYVVISDASDGAAETYIYANDLSTLDNSVDNFPNDQYPRGLTKNGSSVFAMANNGNSTEFGGWDNTVTTSSGGHQLAHTGSALYAATDYLYKLNDSDGSVLWNKSVGGSAKGVSSVHQGGEPSNVGNSVQIRATDQNGNPVKNATVESYGVNTKNLEDKYDDLQERSNELLDQAANPRPNSWNPDLSISDSIAADAESKYVTTHSAGDMGIAGWKESPELQPAQLRFDTGETVYAYVWDPSDGGFVQDGVESEYPGGVDDNTAVVVEQIDHKNDTISKTTYETDETYNVGGLGGEHDYVALNLPPGYYRIYAEGDPQNAVVREVGDPASIIEQDLRDQADKRSEQAQQVLDRINNGKFARQTVTTNESGYATIEVKSGVQILGIQAWKGDGSLVDASNPDPSALRELRASGYDGAIYLSTQPKRVNLNNFDTANDTAQVEVRKWTATPYGNVSRFQNVAEKLQNQLLNETTADLEATYEDRLEQVNRDNLEQRWADLANLLRSNPDARERFLNETDRDQIPSAEDLSDSELRKSLRVAQSALATQPSTGAAGDTTTNVGDGVADFTAILNGEYEPDDVAIFAHYSNGTTQTVPDEYVSVDQSITGSESEIQVNDYPVGQEDPAQVTFEVKAANQNGVDSVRDSIVNPAFGGEVPNLEAVDVSTLRPGPSEPVSVSLRPASDSSYGSLKDVRVFAPDGSELNATLDGERATFETAGQGTHTIRATYTDSTGAKFVETIRLNAQEATTNPPPTVRIEDGGDTVIAGSGLRSARVEETPDGNRVTAVVPGDGDRPGTVHVRGSDAFTGDVTVNVVQGDLEESVDKHVSVVVHTQLPEDALVYRDGRDQPITRDGSTQYGEVETRTGEDGTEKQIIRTYSDASGQLQLEVSRDPGLVERTLYDFRTSGVPLPSIGMLFNAVVIYDEVPTQPPAVVTDTFEQPLLDEATPGEIVPGDAAAAMEVAT